MSAAALLAKPLIFIGTGRSGTTVISKTVMRHPALGFPSNYQEKFTLAPAINWLRPWVDRLPNPRYHFSPAEAYNLWHHLTGSEVDFARGFLLEDRAGDAMRERTRAYFATLVRRQGARRLTFKITGPPRIGFLLSLFPDARFVHLRRDPIPTVRSFLKVDFYQERKHHLWWTGAYDEAEQRFADDNADEPALIAALQIRKILDTVAAEHARHRPPLIEASYEDFVADPRACVTRILEFAELTDNAEACFRHLDALRIEDRNQAAEDAFDPPLLSRIRSVLEGEVGTGP